MDEFLCVPVGTVWSARTEFVALLLTEAKIIRIF